MGEYELYSTLIALVFHTVLWLVVLKIVDVLKDGGKFSEALKSLVVRK